MSVILSSRTMPDENKFEPNMGNTREYEHLPNFVDKCSTIRLLGVGVRCGTDNGKQVITLTVRWLDTTTDARDKWARINNSVTHHATTSPSLHGMLICDGPCHSIVDYTKMVEYPDCGHKICRRCQFNELSVPNADGSPGCCVPMCVRQTLINRVPLGKYRREARQQGTPFLGVKQSATNMSSPQTSERNQPSSTMVPTELLHVKIFILEKVSRQRHG
ncbi:hypothetical protein RB195_015269 [Necator americanus]|uniref:RING-type domain-containing protein n=1 Tax=Necator americanus TaxID=51031 RepID=A0ABR1E3W5_NECAM